MTRRGMLLALLAVGLFGCALLAPDSSSLPQALPRTPTFTPFQPLPSATLPGAAAAYPAPSVAAATAQPLPTVSSPGRGPRPTGKPADGVDRSCPAACLSSRDRSTGGLYPRRGGARSYPAPGGGRGGAGQPLGVRPGGALPQRGERRLGAGGQIRLGRRGGRQAAPAAGREHP